MKFSLEFDDLTSLSKMKTKSISIIGTGLIGSSMALGLKGQCKVLLGFDKNPRNIGYAEKMGVVDIATSYEGICACSDVIIVAVPSDIVPDILRDILSKSKDDTVVIDVSSTKEPICHALKHHPKRKNLIASHPMAGLEVGGPQNADASILIGRKVVICQSELNSDYALGIGLEIFKILGMQPEYMDAEQHDSLVALVSQLPQMVAYGLANTVSKASKDDEWCRLAASGFDSASRLASSPANVWMPIINQNKDFIVQHLNLFINQMENLKEMIADSNKNELMSFIAQSQSVRDKFKKKSLLNEKYNHGNKTVRRLDSASVVETRVE